MDTRRSGGHNWGLCRLLHPGTIPALGMTRYGRVLLLKLGVLSVVVGARAYNWLLP